MKKKELLFWLPTLAASCLAAVLRAVAVSHVDEKGLYLRWDPAFLALQVLTAVLLVYGFWLLRRLKDGSYEEKFPACRLRGALAVAAAGLMAMAALGAPLPAERILGAVAALCMAAGGVCRWQGRRCWPGFHCVVCLFFVLNLIFSFRLWSAEPQLRAFSVQLLACVCLMLYAFRRACWDADIGSIRWTVFLALAAVYFSLASLSDPAPMLYLAGAVWAFASAPVAE